MTFFFLQKNCHRYVNPKNNISKRFVTLYSINHTRCFSSINKVYNLNHVSSYNNNNNNTNNDHLRLIFDDPLVWKQHQQFSHTKLTGNNNGLLEHPFFNNEAGIDFAAKQAIQRAQIIVERICNAPHNGPEEMQRVVKNLDRLSDTLCIVIDLAEFLRNAHPNSTLLNAANNAYTDLCTYMNTLNTDTRLYKVLRKVLENKDIVSKFTPDEHAAAIIFLRDFEKSGIHLPNEQRNKFVELSDQIIQLGRQFIQSDPYGSTHVKISKKDIQDIGSSFLNLNTGKDGFITLPTNSMECRLILKYSKNQNIRKLIYEAVNSANEQNIKILEWLMMSRAELANLVGQKSYASLQLQDKMAKNPTNVEAFLRTLLKHQSSVSVNDINILRQVKQKHLGLSSSPIVNAWDRDYYMHAYNLSQPRMSSPIPNFSVGSVIQGLSRLFSHLYGVHFEPAHMQPGESWHDHVRKLNVICEREGKIGIIYCDLFSRPGKTTNAAHYTIRTSRRIDNDDQDNDIQFAFPGQNISSNQFLPPLTIDHFASETKGQAGTYQLPVIVLTCDFNDGVNSNSINPSFNHLLSMFEVETLFHEMGHAMHSMLGRTEYHNVSGTRCATDFVELPSILMEQFLTHPEVLCLFSNDTNHLISPEAIKSYLHHRKLFNGIEVNSQILMSMVDLQYHSLHMSKFKKETFSTVHIWHQLQDDIGLFPSVPGTMWPVQFGHLFGYGASYYSYLFDRTLAQRIWKKCFERNPLNRNMGLKFRDQLLKWGGAKDPWKSIADVLGEEDGEKIANGDEISMRTVGDWGIDM